MRSKTTATTVLPSSNPEPVRIQWCSLVVPSAPVAGAQMLMTRATREKLAAQRSGSAAAGSAAHAVVRVRLPDGVIVQVLHGKGWGSAGLPLVSILLSWQCQ